jgi:hypothetical protein
MALYNVSQKATGSLGEEHPFNFLGPFFIVVDNAYA